MNDFTQDFEDLDQIDFDYYSYSFDDDDDDELLEDLCCYESRDTGPKDSCYCKEMAELDRKMANLHYKAIMEVRFFPYSIFDAIANLFKRIKNRLIQKKNNSGNDLPF